MLKIKHINIEQYNFAYESLNRLYPDGDGKDTAQYNRLLINNMFSEKLLIVDSISEDMCIEKQLKNEKYDAGMYVYIRNYMFPYNVMSYYHKMLRINERLEVFLLLE